MDIDHSSSPYCAEGLAGQSSGEYAHKTASDEAQCTEVAAAVSVEKEQADTGEHTRAEGEASATQRLASAKQRFARKNGAHYPPAQGREVEMHFRLLPEFHQGAIFKRIKLGEVSVKKKTPRVKKFQFKREWYQPLAWLLDTLCWSASYSPCDTTPERRKTTISFVELACLADILTGGAIGPRRGTFAEKAAIIKEGIAQLMKKVSVYRDKDEDTVPAVRFLQFLPSVCSAAPLGFPALPGINRRPMLAKFPGAHSGRCFNVLRKRRGRSACQRNAPLPLVQSSLERGYVPKYLGASHGLTRWREITQR